MGHLQIPMHVGELTPPWLTSALHANGTISHSRVESFVSEPLGEGLLGQVDRLVLQYDEEEPGAPRTMIVKFPTPYANIRNVASRAGFFEREIRYYKELAGHVDLRSPICYFADYDQERDLYVLLLEDLAPGRTGDQVAGLTPGEMDLAISHLARFHATWWEKTQLHDFAWMPRFDSLTDTIRPALDKNRQKIADGLPQESRQLIASMDVVNIRHRLASAPQTMVHGDYRATNLFFPSDRGGVDFAVIDWQMINRGPGTWDVAYFLSQNVTPDRRRHIEEESLRKYHSVLEEQGVRSYTFERCFFDYRLSMLDHLCRWVFLDSVGNTDPNWVSFAKTWLERLLAANMDLKNLEIVMTSEGRRA